MATVPLGAAALFSAFGYMLISLASLSGAASAGRAVSCVEQLPASVQIKQGQDASGHELVKTNFQLPQATTPERVSQLAFNTRQG
jgi:hypothetical protein